MVAPRSLLDGRDLLRATEILVDGLLEDPAFKLIFPKESKRPTQLQWLMYRWLFGTNGVAKLSKCHRGVAIWISPEYNPDVSFLTMLKVGMLKFPFLFGWKATARLLQLDECKNAPRCIAKEAGLGTGLGCRETFFSCSETLKRSSSAGPRRAFFLRGGPRLIVRGLRDEDFRRVIAMHSYYQGVKWVEMFQPNGTRRPSAGG